MASLATAPSPPSIADGQYFNPKEAAKCLRVSERWLRDGVNHNGFPHSRPGRRLVFSADDLKAIYDRFRSPGYTVTRRPRTRRTA